MISRKLNSPSNQSVPARSTGENRKLQVHQIFFERGVWLFFGILESCTDCAIEFFFFFETGNMGKVLPEFLSKWTTERVREEGVNVIPKTEVKNVDTVGNQLKLTLNDGQTILCDRVVVAVGSAPNTTLGQESGLEIEANHGGYLVNAELAARNNLYVVSEGGSCYSLQSCRPQCNIFCCC